ncbi:hypothetical protein [Mycobacterium intracellulare]|nr:hypothetical protein [Mycobacterium intracellulare]
MSTADDRPPPELRIPPMVSRRLDGRGSPHWPTHKGKRQLGQRLSGRAG